MNRNDHDHDAAIHQMTVDQAEPERRESDEQFRELLAHLEQVFWIKNAADDAVIYISPAYATVWGRTCQSLCDNYQSFLDAIHPEDRERASAVMAGQLESGGYEQEYRILRPDGTVRWIWARSYPVYDRQRRLMRFAGIAEDVTEIKKLEEQFRQAQRMEAMGQLAAGVAHGFNNLITVISGYSELLLRMLPPADPARDLLNEIRKAVARAASLTHQLLGFSRKQVLELKVVSLNDVVAGSEKLLKRLVGEDVAVTTVLAPALGRVETDPGQMEQVLINLVVNARDAMPQGGKLTIETANTVLDQTYGRAHADVKPGRYVVLTVTDTGGGMNDQTMARIFEPFFTTKEEGRGTGLGLAMIHGFVKQSGGHVSVRSEPGKGSTFKVFLPEAEADLASDASSLTTLEKTPTGHETILLVEDEETVRSLARLVLQKCGYAVLAAAQGDEAIQMAEAHQGPIHLLISDVVMPGMDGPRVAERIGALKPGIRVLFLSGYADAAVIRHGILASEVAFLQKPFTPSALAREVRTTLDLSIVG